MTFFEKISSIFSRDSGDKLTKANPLQTAPPGPQPKQGQIGLMLRLEKRLMFDGAGFVPGLDLICNPEIGDATVEQTQEQEIVFIDSNVDNYNTLIKDIDPNALVVVLDPNQEAVEQISDVLDDYTDLSAIHLVSHGGPGSLDLAGGELNLDNITQQGDLIKGWGDSLNENADILIYGCDVGSGEVGQKFISQLADMTGADIAASDDLTGDVDKGGDWDLESTTGHIEATAFPTAAAQSNFNGTLATITVTDAGDSGAGTLRQAVTDAADGDTITFAAALDGDTINLTSGQIQFTKDITIDGDLDGDQVADITIDANNNSRHFYVNASEVELIGLNMQNGIDNGGWGGSIFNTGNLTIVDSTLSNNSSTSSGGVMYTTGDTTIIRSTLSNNNSDRNAGAIYHTGNLTIVDTTLANNTAGAAASSGGGAIYSSGGTLNLYSSTLNDNQVVDGSGGGIYINNGAVSNIYSSTISNNSADDWAGGIYVKDGNLTISSTTIAFNDATNNDGGGIFNDGGTVTLYNSIVSDNDSGGSDDIAGIITNNDYNLVNDKGGATYGVMPNDQNSGAQLDALATVAGYTTQIHKLGGASSASGAGVGGNDIGTTANFSPVLNNLTSDTLNYNEEDGAVFIEQGGDAIVSDADSFNFDGGSLTVAITANHDSSEDILAIFNEGSGAGEIGVVGSNITYEGDIIGTYTGGTGANDLVVTFDWQADTTAVTALIKNITYENSDSDNPTDGNKTIQWSLDDGNNSSVATVTNTITINQTNDAPTATNVSAAESFAEDDAAFSLTDIVVTDVDINETVTVTLTLSDATAGTLSTTTANAVTSTFVGGVWTANGLVADVNTLLADVTFTPTADYDQNFTIATAITDGVAAAVIGSKAVTVTGVNDAPTATNLSSAEAFTEDDAAFILTDIVVSEVDTNETVTVTLTLSDATAGTLSTATANAVTSTFVGGVWSASGFVDDVNTLLAGVTFTPGADYEQDFSIATSVTDGETVAQTGSKNFTVTALNDAPTATNMSASDSFTEDAGAAALTDIVITDVDADETVTVKLTMSDTNAGRLSTATSNGVTSSFSGGVWQASGLVADVNTLLANVTFTPSTNYDLDFTIATSVTD
ncbi:MAG: DUF4347 domain-containing protein, partial [Magnetococcales bacterium]|nr:DUF4347 domain-containing protein [Magnetococcales bacterium]